MNPFEQEAGENLYCLSTGQKVNDEIKLDLPSFIEKGETWCNEFIEECLKDPSHLEKAIPQWKVKNFPSAAVTTCVDVKGEITELHGTRDLFGQLLYLSTLKEIGLEKVFHFPLTPVPLCLARVDGSMKKP